MLEHFEITEEDAFAGCKTIALEKRDGGKVELVVNAPSWRVRLALQDVPINRTGEATRIVVETCLDPKIATEELLNSLVPLSLTAIFNTAVLLSLGVIELRKRQAAKA